jgi:hypothetical protein
MYAAALFGHAGALTPIVVDRQAMIDTVLLGFREAVGQPIPLSSPASRHPAAQPTSKARPPPRPATRRPRLQYRRRRSAPVRIAQVFTEQAIFRLQHQRRRRGRQLLGRYRLKQPFLTSAWSMRPPGKRGRYTRRVEEPTERPTTCVLLGFTTVEADDFLLPPAVAPPCRERRSPMFIHQVLAMPRALGSRVQNFN